jgi:hypothetical protein
MNSYQKLAVLMLRVLGAAVVVYGFHGLVPYYAYKLGIVLPTNPTAEWLTGLEWGVTGLCIILVAKPIGRLFGRGLD